MKRYDKIRFEHFLIAILLLQVIINFIFIGRIWNINTEILDTAYEWLHIYYKWIWNWILGCYVFYLLTRNTKK